MGAITNWVSAKEIMTRVVRNCGGKIPGSYTDDILEWIPQAMKMMKTKHQFMLLSTPNKDCAGELRTKNHCVMLPCGIQHITGIEDEFGKKVMIGSDQTSLGPVPPSTQYHSGSKNAIDKQSARSTNFQMDAFNVSGVDPGAPGFTSDDTAVNVKGDDIISTANGMAFSSYYVLNGPWLQTSLEEMFIKIHYRSIHVDSEGYPLAPDNENYLQAATWFVLRELIAAGYDHKRFGKVGSDAGWGLCDQQWDKYSALALGQIRYPSVEEMARFKNSFGERLIPPQNFTADFFVGAEIQSDVNY